MSKRIVGSGITGLVAAYGLLKAGNDVSLYSDRTPDQWLNESRPSGTAARFESALLYERSLGLNHWDHLAPEIQGAFLLYSPTLHSKLIKLTGRLNHPMQAIDMRLQCHRWLSDLPKAGAKVFIEKIELARLDDISAENELTIVATGKDALACLFPRDEEKSVHSSPQRNLAMMIVKGCPAKFNDISFLSARLDLLATDGELFFIPFYHKNGEHTWNILFEARAGSRMDIFSGIRNGEELVPAAKKVIAELFPWHSIWAEKMELADPNGWLTGAVKPEVRMPVGILPSGRAVMALGDANISFDPIAAQGANTGIKQVAHLVSAIEKRKNSSFDVEWMNATFEEFFKKNAEHANALTNLLLDPSSAAGSEILIAQSGSDGFTHSPAQKIANVVVENFNDPNLLTPSLVNLSAARQFISGISGRHWVLNNLNGRLAIIKHQLGYRFRKYSTA